MTTQDVQAQPLSGMRRALEELTKNSNTLLQLRTQGIEKGAQLKGEEVRQAKARFTERKLKLLDKITKKHMLEEIWYDRVEIGAEEQREAERETLVKKEEVRYVKGLNAQLLQALGGQASDIGAAVGQFEEGAAALASKFGSTERAQATAGEQRQREAALLEAVAAARASARGCDERLRVLQAEAEELRRQTEAVEEQAADAKAHDRQAVEEQVAQSRTQAHSLAARQRERAAYFEEVGSVLRSLSGIDCEPAGAHTLRYTLHAPSPVPPPVPPSLLVSLEPETGVLRSARLEASDVNVNDIIAHAVAMGSLEFLLRETQLRLATGAAAFILATPRPIAWASAAQHAESASMAVAEASTPASVVTNLDARLADMDSIRGSQASKTSAATSDGSRDLPPPPPSAETPSAVEMHARAAVTAGVNAAGANTASVNTVEAATPLPMSVRPLDARTLSVLDSARHKRRASRKSFSRAVSLARSPCARAANAGVASDAKQALSTLGAAEGASGRVRMRVLDAQGTLRATLAADGTVTNSAGEVLAYIEADGSVGDAELRFVGEVAGARNDGSLGYVSDAADVAVAEVDYGLAVIRDLQGSTLAEVQKGGCVLGHWGASCGRLEGFDFHMLQPAAAYLVLVDPEFVRGNCPKRGAAQLLSSRTEKDARDEKLGSMS